MTSPPNSLKIIEGPIRYVGRTYGKTQISRFHHGLLLLRMVCLRFCASKRLKLDAIIHPPERILESSHQPGNATSIITRVINNFGIVP
jgi:hypothetical protein